MKQVESVSPPWWQVTPIDFVTDVLIPFTLHDRREFDYMLQPETSKETLENVQKRAIELREKLNKDK